jgi:hypothetical protein
VKHRMRLSSRLYSVMLRAYPRDFRDENREEMLGTIADLHDSGESKCVLLQAISLGYNGNRLRWLRATGGSVAQTFRYGLAWGVMVLIARQAGLGLNDILRRVSQPWRHPTPIEIASFLGWLLVLGLLVTGRRKWGLGLLLLVLAGYVATSTDLALGYGGRFSWPFTLHFFLPVALPLLCAFLPPAKVVRWPERWAAALVLLFAVVPPLTMVFLEHADSLPAYLVNSTAIGVAGYAQLAGVLPVGIFVLLASLSDPRWAVAAAFLVFVYLIQNLLQLATNLGNGGVGFLSDDLGVLIPAVAIPAGALLLSLWARRRAAPRRAR